ncbi:hypothetical protein ACJZ2D_015990 [Fusarium nematophilum]
MGILALAKQRGFSSDRSTISPHVVPQKLRPNSQLFYDRDLELWDEYEKEFGSSDPREMQVMKHFAEFVALGTVGKLDKENELPTTDSVRNKMRRFYSNWQRKTHQTIPAEVTLSMAPYIEGELADKIGLKNINRAQGFLTTENFVKLQEKLWFSDHHDYVHEGYRVDNATLLNTHCYTSARLSELCQAKYKDVVFLVGWKDGEPELKLKIQRRVCKGKDKKQPEHILYERLSSNRGPPPLYAQPILFFLANFLSSGAIKGNPTLEDMLNYTPPQHRRHWVFEWKEDMLEKPIFPDWTADGPQATARSPYNWSHQASRWAIRAGFIDGCGMHCPRRDSLLKANDSGASIEQVLKYADQQNSAVLRRNYLGSMNTIDGTGCFLGMDVRQDLTEDFRSATMRWILDLPLGLSAQAQAELGQQDDWMKLSQNIKDLTFRIEQEGISDVTREQLKAERKQSYVKRRRLEAAKLREVQKNQPLEYWNERKPHEQGDWRHGHFARIMNLLPERKRLSHALFSAVPLRSHEGLSALRDTIALRTNPCHIAYQDILRPSQGTCPVPSCHTDMESIPLRNQTRWKHVFRCWERHYREHSPFVRFCSLCNYWVKSEPEWLSHCRNHIENRDLPFRCDPVFFRNATACAGYCPVHLGNEECPADQRLHQFWDKSGWQRHVSTCVMQYIQAEPNPSNLSCPHPECPVISRSPEQLWIHLKDIHSVSREPSAKRKQCNEAGQGDDENSSPTKKLRTQFQVGGDQTYDGFWKGGAYHMSAGWILSDAKAIPEVPTEHSASSLSGVGDLGHVWDEQGSIFGSDIPPSSLSVSSANTIYSNQGDDMSLRSRSLERSTVGSRDDLKVEKQRHRPLTASGGNYDSAFSPVSPSARLNPTPHENGPSNSPSSSPRNNPNLANFEDHISTRNPGLLQPASVIRTEKPEASAMRSHEDGYSEGRRASEKLQDILSLSGNLDMIDPQLSMDHHSQEHAKSTEADASSPTQSYLEGAQPSQPIALDEDDEIWEVDRLLAKWKQGRQALYLVKWKGFPNDANSWQKRNDISDELVSDRSSDSFSLHDDDSVFDVDGDGLSDMDTDPTDASDAVSDHDLDVCSPGGSIYGEVSASEDSASDDDGDQLSDIDSDPSDASDAEPDADDACPGGGNDLPPEFFLQMQEDSDDEDANKTLYADSTTKQLDGIEWRWTAYCEYTKQDPKLCLQNLSFGKAKAFFTWVVTQKTGVGGRRLPGLESARSFNQYWEGFRLVYERETGKKIDSLFKRKMCRVIRTLVIKHKLTSQPRENRCMTIENLEKQAKKTISTTRKRFRIAVLDRKPSSSCATETLTFTFLGDKEINTLTLPETIFDSSLLLSPHTYLLGLIFHHKAFQAPSLTSPEHLSKLDIHPGELELPLPLKQDMDDVFVFRDTVKTALGGHMLSANKQITYQMIAGWVKRMGELAGFIIAVILYTLRYNSANEFDNSPNISDGLRNLLLQHASSNIFRKHYLGRVVSADTMAIVRHTKQQEALMRQACSVGHSISTRRPTDLTPEQSAAVNDDPQIQALLRKRLELAKGPPAARKKLGDITKAIQSLRAKLRRDYKQKYRKGWSRQQAVVDIERQLAGKTFEEPPMPSSPSDEAAHPAQERLLQALTAPVADTIEAEYRRRNNAILAVMAYCPIQEGPSRRTGSTARSNKSSVSGRPKATDGELKTNDAISAAITSVYVRNPSERSRRCFLCVERATTLGSCDPDIERLIKSFYSAGDLSKHFKRHHLSNIQDDEKLHCRLCDLPLDHKMHLQNHAETVHGIVSRGG